jgi:flavin-dependent dehydrogenase
MSSSTEAFDVVVAGAGPGGSAAAKRCAQRGLRTLLLEKKKLPRDKVCSGMVMGPWAHRIIREEFGDIPQEVLASPYELRGHMIHVPGAEPRVIEWRMPLAWRRDLDFWMNQNAEDQGVVIWDGAKVVRVEQRDGRCTVVLKKKQELKALRAGFVIGADGAASRVRKSLFPGLKVLYSAPVRQRYKGSLDIEREYIHWFFPRIRPRPRFDLIHKGDGFLLEGSGIRELGEDVRDILSSYGFDAASRPLWRDGCLMPLLHQGLLAGSFIPAQENVLLIGDAAGLFFPNTFEGIGPALKSGLLAADSVAETTPVKRKAARIYLHELKSFLGPLKSLYSLQESLKNAPEKGPRDLSRALKKVYEEALRVA